MVVFDLTCSRQHRFELWVPSAAALDEQIAKGWVQCPFCGTTEVRRLPAAPAIGSRKVAEETTRQELKPLLEAWWAKLQKLKLSAEEVGSRFPEEARRIHHGLAQARPIKGKATRDEAQALWDEGIWVVPLPPDPDELQ